MWVIMWRECCLRGVDCVRTKWIVGIALGPAVDSFVAMDAAS